MRPSRPFEAITYIWFMRWIYALLLSSTQLGAEPVIIEDFGDGLDGGWRYVSDRVMGGVSDGQALLLQEAGLTFARLEGQVSTANNGGFIQIRHQLDVSFDAASTGLSLRVRGTGERYYVHLRPTSSRRPWQFFQAGFDTNGSWQEITLPWSKFVPQGGLQGAFDPSEITSMGLVAYGADYVAQLDVAKIKVE